MRENTHRFRSLTRLKEFDVSDCGHVKGNQRTMTFVVGFAIIVAQEGQGVVFHEVVRMLRDKFCGELRSTSFMRRRGAGGHL